MRSKLWSEQLEGPGAGMGEIGMKAMQMGIDACPRGRTSGSSIPALWLSPEGYVIRWNEGCEMRTWILQNTIRFSLVKKRDRDYMGSWYDREHIGSGQGAVDTVKPPKIIFRTVQRKGKAPWIQCRSAKKKNSRRTAVWTASR